MSESIESAEQAPAPDHKSRKKEERRRRHRVLTGEDLSIIMRVLRYARPYRAQIMGALVVGIFAGFLTALNLLALVPVLEIVLEDTDQAKLVRIQEDIQEKRDRIASEDKFVDMIQPYFDLKKHQFRYQWNLWVMDMQEKAIYYLAVLLVLSQFLKAILDFFSKYTLQKTFYLAVVRLRNDLYARCMWMDMPEFQKLTSGDLIARLNNDMRAVRLVFSNLLSTVILDPITVVFLLLSMLFLNWQMTLVVMVGLPIIVVPISLIGKKLRTMGKRDEEEDARILSYTQETIQGLMIVKAFTGEYREMAKFRRLSKEVARRQIRREKYRLYSEPFVEVMATIAMAIVLCIGAYLIIKSDKASMNPPEFLIYLGIMTRFYPPIKRLMSTFVKVQKSLASAERIFEIVDMDRSIKEAPDALEQKSFEREIEFDDVAFSYGRDKAPALKGFSLRIEKGRKIALVGRTGAGKSTVARLLPRLYEVDEGVVRLDGRDIRDLTLHSLRRQMAYVTQETILFNDSIFENIRYGKPEATLEEVEEAARAAYAHEFIETLPQGYHTMIGERGGQLSGGQRQRLAIARALLSNTPILLLDEATSALDNESERIVQAAIERLMQDRTVLVIAHRLSTVRKADEIVVMENGAIVERGTHEELIGRQGKYYDLLQAEELAND